MKRSILYFLVAGGIAVTLLGVYSFRSSFTALASRILQPESAAVSPILQDGENRGTAPQEAPHPLSIAALRAGDYPGSELVVEQELEPGSTYSRAIVSYKSEGLQQYALLTIPFGDKPASGWPVIVFNHGYIPPAEYRTTERYIAYTDAFSRNGYMLIRPDYRGHGNSEGVARGGYGSNDYTIDVLNAVASVKRHPDADPDRIGMWGHSMGGHITLRSMVTTSDVKAGVIWAGVVASYPDLLHNWRLRGEIIPRGVTPTQGPSPTIYSGRGGGWRTQFLQQYGDPQENPEFWNSISSNSYLADLSGPVQIHHGTADDSVPVQFAETLDRQLREAGQAGELYLYEGDDHNLSGNFGIAMERSVAFFDRSLKAVK